MVEISYRYGHESVHSEEEIVDGGQCTKLKKWMKGFVRKQLVLPPLEPVLITTKNPEPVPLNAKQRFYICFAWSVQFIVIFICLFFILLYGLKFGPFKTVVILTIIGVNILKGLILNQTLVMIVFALAAALILRNYNRTITFKIDPGGVRQEGSEKQGYEEQLLELRAQRMYHPMSDLDIMIARKRRAENIWKPVLLIFMIIIFIFFVIIATSINSQPPYYNSEHIRYTLFSSSRPPVSASQKIIDKKSFIPFLLWKLLPSIRGGVIRNSEGDKSSFEKHVLEGWFVDLKNKIVGVPRLRQIRVTEGTCSVPNPFNEVVQTCTGPLLSGNEETGSFALSWKKPNTKQTGPAIWNYTDKTESLLMYGATGLTYPGGGYILNLTEKLRNSQLHVARGYFFDWLDTKTRAVIMDFNVYNAHASIFSHVSIIVEYLASGVSLARATIDSIFFRFFTPDDLLLVIIIVMLLIILILIGVQVSLLISAMGFSYFRSFGRVCDLFVIFFGILTLLSGLATARYFTAYSKKFVEPVEDTFISFMYPFHQYCLTFVYLCMFIITATIRLLTLADYGPRYYLIKRALKDSLVYIISGIIFLICALSLVAILLYSTGRQHSVIFPVFPFPRSHFINYHIKTDLQNESIFFLVFTNWSYIALQLYFICTFVYFYGRAKFEMEIKGEGKHRENIFNVIFASISNGIKILFNPRKTNEAEKLRLRGGGSSFEDVIAECFEATGTSESLNEWLGRKTESHRKLSQQLDLLIEFFEKDTTI